MSQEASRTPGPGGRAGSRPAARTPRGTRVPSAFREIVVCLDRSAPSEATLPHAQRVARREGARLTLLNVMESPTRDATAGLPPDPLEWHLRRASARTYLDGLCGRSHAVSARLAAEVLQGDAAEQVCAFAARANADLVVLAAHGEGRRTRYCLGSTAAKIVERVPTSILVVPSSRPGAETAPEHYRRILVPLDGSARAESVLPLVTSLGREHGADLLLVHVVCAPDPMPAEPPEPEDVELQRRFRRRNEARAFRYLARLRYRLADAGLRVKTLVRRGSCPRRELTRVLAEEGVDLVVVSTHGRTGRTEEPFGSVSTHLIRTHAVPVLVVREPGATAAWRRRMLAESEGPPAPVVPESR